MFDSIIFDLNPYFGYSATFVYFSLHPMEFAMSLDAFILLSPWEEELHSSCDNRCTHLTAHSSKRFISLSVIILVFLRNKKQDCKTNCFIIGPPSVDF